MGEYKRAARIELKRRELPLKRSSKATNADRCRRKFLRYFPGGFYGEKYLSWERDYKTEAHERWVAELAKTKFEKMLGQGRYQDIAQTIVRIESRTNLLFSFEKMALRDAVKSPGGARDFARGMFAFLHGPGSMRARFEALAEVIAALPRKQTRVLTWPMITVFGFIAQPSKHIFLKPNVTREAARAYGYEDFRYVSKPNWDTYASLLGFAKTIEADIEDLEPRDMIDLQSFIWVLGSDEYP